MDKLQAGRPEGAQRAGDGRGHDPVGSESNRLSHHSRAGRRFIIFLAPTRRPLDVASFVSAAPIWRRPRVARRLLDSTFRWDRRAMNYGGAELAPPATTGSRPRVVFIALGGGSSGGCGLLPGLGSASALISEVRVDKSFRRRRRLGRWPRFSGHPPGAPVEANWLGELQAGRKQQPANLISAAHSAAPDPIWRLRGPAGLVAVAVVVVTRTITSRIIRCRRRVDREPRIARQIDPHAAARRTSGAGADS